MEVEIIGNGEPLVLVHGLGQHHGAWNLQHNLSDTYQLICPTLRGHGKGNQSGKMTIYQFAKDILALLDDLYIESAHFCGLSLGGVVIQELYAQARHRVRSLVLANTTSYAPHMPTYLAVQERIKALSEMTEDEFIADTLSHCLYQSDQETIEEARKSFHINRKAYLEASKAIQGKNYLSLLTMASIPIHIIASSHDTVTPYSFNAALMQWAAPRASCTVFNQTGHLSNIEKPDQFNAVIRKFLRDA